MNLPESLSIAQSWTVVGPMGPEVPAALLLFPVMGVDGGSHFTQRLDFWVGDHDSVKGVPSCLLRMDLDQHKDSSDLAHAFQLLLTSQVNHIHLWGFLGGRKDHELFNLGEGLNFLEARPGTFIDMYDHRGKISFKLLSKGQWEFDYEGTFSLGSAAEARVTLSGDCQYPIFSPHILKPLSSFGLSNIATGKVSLNTSGPVFISFPEDK